MIRRSLRPSLITYTCPTFGKDHAWHFDPADAKWHPEAGENADCRIVGVMVKSSMPAGSGCSPCRGESSESVPE